MTKCDFCQYHVGRECVAAKDATGKAPFYCCRAAWLEYQAWKARREKRQ